MTPEELQSLIDDATFDYAMGDAEPAITKLKLAAATAPDSFAAWHALAEINFSLRRLEDALQAAEKAHALNHEDLFINTTLSRIWMERRPPSLRALDGTGGQSHRGKIRGPSQDAQLEGPIAESARASRWH